ncbi:MAG: cobalamin biosynthesis protein [Actinomycetota bacterium]|nr:cobalamin biosynthesis protein [Actinomycetota bacterium]
MLALGVGMSSSALHADLREVVGTVLAEAGWEWDEVAVVGTTRRLAQDQRLVRLGPRLLGFDRRDLEAVAVPSRPSSIARRLLVPPVAEAAALLAAGTGSRILVPKRAGRYVTVAAAVGGGR